MDGQDSISKVGSYDQRIKVNGLTSIPALLVQKRLYWFGHDARRLEGELIN